MLRLDQLEALYYELQLQLYDIQAEVLRCEELLLTAQLQSLRRQMTGESVVCWFTALTLLDSVHVMLTPNPKEAQTQNSNYNSDFEQQLASFEHQFSNKNSQKQI